MAQLKKYNFKKDVNPVFECIKRQAALAGLTDYPDPFALGKFGYDTSPSGSRTVNIVRSRHIVEGRDALVRSAQILAGLNKADYLNRFIGRPDWTDETDGVTDQGIKKLVKLPEKNIWYEELERACQPLDPQEKIFDLFASKNDGRAFLWVNSVPSKPHFVDFMYYMYFSSGTSWELINFTPVLVNLASGADVTAAFNISTQFQVQFFAERNTDLRDPDIKTKATLINDTTPGARAGDTILCLGIASARDRGTGEIYNDIVIESPCTFTILSSVDELVPVMSGVVIFDNNLKQTSVAVLGQPAPYVLGRYTNQDQDVMIRPSQTSVQLNITFYNTTLGTTFRIKNIKLSRQISFTNLSSGILKMPGSQLRKTFGQAMLLYGAAGQAGNISGQGSIPAGSGASIASQGDTYGSVINFEEGVFTETSRSSSGGPVPITTIVGMLTMFNFSSMGQGNSNTVRTPTEQPTVSTPGYNSGIYTSTLATTRFLESIGGPTFDGGNVPQGLIVRPNEPQGTTVTYEVRVGESDYKYNFNVTNPVAGSDPNNSNLGFAYSGLPLDETKASTPFSIETDYETVSLVPNIKPKIVSTAVFNHIKPNPAYAPVSNRNYYRRPFFNRLPLSTTRNACPEHRPNVLSLYPGKYKVRLIGGPFNILDDKRTTSSPTDLVRTGLGRWSAELSIRDLSITAPQVSTFLGSRKFFDNEKSAIIESTKETPKGDKVRLMMPMPYTYQNGLTPVFSSGIDNITPASGPLAGGTALFFQGSFRTFQNKIESILIGGVPVINPTYFSTTFVTGTLPPGTSYGKKHVTLNTININGIAESITYYNVFEYVNSALPVPSAPYLDNLSLFSDCRVTAPPVINGKFLNTVSSVTVGGVPVPFTVNSALTQIAITSMPKAFVSGYCVIEVTMYDDWTFIVFSGGAEKLANGSYRSVPYRNIEVQISDRYPLYVGGENSLCLKQTAIEIVRLDDPAVRLKDTPGSGFVTDIFVEKSTVEHFLFTGPDDTSAVVDVRTSPRVLRKKAAALSRGIPGDLITPPRTMDPLPRQETPSLPTPSRTFDPPVTTPSRTQDPEATPTRIQPHQLPPITVVTPRIVYTPPPPVIEPPTIEPDDPSTPIRTSPVVPSQSQLFVRVTIRIRNNYDVPMLVRELHLAKGNGPLEMETWQMPYGWESVSSGVTSDGFSIIRPQYVDALTTTHVNIIKYGHPSICIQGKDTMELSFVFRESITGNFLCRAVLDNTFNNSHRVTTATGNLEEDQFISRASQPTIDTSKVKYGPTALKNLFRGNVTLRPRITNLYSHAVHKSTTAATATETFTGSTNVLLSLTVTDATSVTVIKRDSFGIQTGLRPTIDFVFLDGGGVGGVGRDAVRLNGVRNATDTYLVTYERISAPGTVADFVHWDLYAPYCTSFGEQISVTKYGLNTKTTFSTTGNVQSGGATTTIRNVTGINGFSGDFYTDSFAVPKFRRVRVLVTGASLDLYVRKGVAPSEATFDFSDVTRDGTPDISFNTADDDTWYIMVKWRAFVTGVTVNVTSVPLEQIATTVKLACTDEDPINSLKYPRGLYKTDRRYTYDMIGDESEYAGNTAGPSYIPMYTDPLPLTLPDLFMLSKDVNITNPNTGMTYKIIISTGMLYEKNICTLEYQDTKYFPMNDVTGTVLNNPKYKVNGYGLERITTAPSGGIDPADLPVIVPYMVRRTGSTTFSFLAESVRYPTSPTTLYDTSATQYSGALTIQEAIHPSSIDLVSYPTAPSGNTLKNQITSFTPNPTGYGVPVGPSALIAGTGLANSEVVGERLSKVGVNIDMIHKKSGVKVAEFKPKPFIYLNRYKKNHLGLIPLLNGFTDANSGTDQDIYVYYYTDFEPAPNSGFAKLYASGPAASSGLQLRFGGGPKFGGGRQRPPFPPGATSAASINFDHPFLASPGSITYDISNRFVFLDTELFGDPNDPLELQPTFLFQITDTNGSPAIGASGGRRFPAIFLEINGDLTRIPLY